MDKIFILGLLIGFTLSEEPYEENSPCELAEPESPGDCFAARPEFLEQTCCFFRGTFLPIEGGEKVHKNACLEAYRRDVSTGEKKAETQKKIEEGTYWKDYPSIDNIESFLCFDEISECEKIQPAENKEECFNAHPELTSETCCYIESDWVEPNWYGDGRSGIRSKIPYCVDIRKKDIKNKKAMKEVENMIKNHTYWEGIDGFATTISNFKCFSNSLKINLFTLALVLFAF